MLLVPPPDSTFGADSYNLYLQFLADAFRNGWSKDLGFVRDDVRGFVGRLARGDQGGVGQVCAEDGAIEYDGSWWLEGSSVKELGAAGGKGEVGRSGLGAGTPGMVEEEVGEVQSGDGSLRTADELRHKLCGVVSADGSGEGNVKCVASSSGVVVSEKTLENRKRRQERKERKKLRQAGMNGGDWRKRASASESVTELRASLEAKWKAQNAVAVEKAQQELEIVKLRDVAKEAKKREVAVTRQTECSKVAIEKAFGSLKTTGNVPGFCETVVSGGTPSLSTGSISPNSSVSEAEVRKVVKELEDLKMDYAKLRKRVRERDMGDLKDGKTIALSVDMSEGLVAEMDEICEGYMTMTNYPEDPETMYVKRQEISGEF